jgi:hypothetical protein
MRLVKIMLCAVALVAFLTPSARADEWNKKTILTFSGPVQIPGATLAAGTYVFKLADLNGNRHVVQVFDKDEKHVYGTILAIPDKRLEPTDDPVVLFAERPAGTPQAIRAWFYPGDMFGDEFVYPKSQAVRIAKATHSSVLATEDANNTSDNEHMKSAKVGRVDENGTMSSTDNTNANTAANTTAQSNASQSSTAPSAAASTTASDTAAAATTTSADAKLKTGSGRNVRARNNARANANRNQAVGTSGQASSTTANGNNANARTNRRARLPQTASNLALFELLSGLSLAGAFGIRRLRARAADVR